MRDHRAPDDFGRADLHLHTLSSDGLMSAREVVDYAEENTALDVIAITDHDDVEAALEAREYAERRQYRVQVVTGVEVTTRDGHLLALFLERRPTALRPLLETLEWIKHHDGVAIAPHPFTRWTHSLSGAPLRRAAEQALLTGVEVLNASPAGRASQKHAARFAHEHGLALAGGSDAHMLRIVGLAHTRFPGRTPEDLRRALETRATLPEGRFAKANEIAAEALPQLSRSMIHLPLRRLARLRNGGARNGDRTPSQPG